MTARASLDGITAPTARGAISATTTITITVTIIGTRARRQPPLMAVLLLLDMMTTRLHDDRAAKTRKRTGTTLVRATATASTATTAETPTPTTTTPSWNRVTHDEIIRASTTRIVGVRSCGVGGVSMPTTGVLRQVAVLSGHLAWQLRRGQRLMEHSHLQKVAMVVMLAKNEAVPLLLLLLLLRVEVVAPVRRWTRARARLCL